MGTDEDDVLARREEGEPAFVLVGKDPEAGPTIRVWAALRAARGESPAVIENALAVAAACERFAISKGKLALVERAAAATHVPGFEK